MKIRRGDGSNTDQVRSGHMNSEILADADSGNKDLGLVTGI